MTTCEPTGCPLRTGRSPCSSAPTGPSGQYSTGPGHHRPSPGSTDRSSPCSQAGGRDRRSWRQRLERRAAPPAWSASLGGLILRYHPGWDAPPLTDRDAMVLRPGPDIAAELTARRGAGRPAKLSPPGLAGVLDERCELLAERGRVLLAQVDFIVRATEREPHRLIRRAAIQIVFQGYGYSLSHLNLHNCDGALHRTQRSVICYSRNAADQAQVPGKPFSLPE